MSSRTPMVAGNWKMNGRLSQAQALAQVVAAGAPARVQVVLCPPFPYLQAVNETLQGSDVHLAAQDLALEEDGAFTGEVSGEMLRDSGCELVLVGHSERRAMFAESNDVVAGKYRRALDAGLIPILCVGESLAERDADATLDVVRGQLDAVLELVGAAGLARGVVAYEPVWAIGTGRTATPEQAQAVHAAMREHVAAVDADVAESLQLLYGGSVKADNAASLFAEPDIDGGLVGGASLDADTFIAICQAATS
jgi:triosephosphate isomerase